MASVYVGRERKQAVFERALRDFRLFCARARAESMLDGKTRCLIFVPEENIFRVVAAAEWNKGASVMLAEEIEGGVLPYVVTDAIDPDWEEELAGEENIRVDEAEVTEREWSFPEKLGVTIELPELEGEAVSEDTLELWRFTRGGAARMRYALTVQFNEDIRTIKVSDFTGEIEVIAGELSTERTVW